MFIDDVVSGVKFTHLDWLTGSWLGVFFLFLPLPRLSPFLLLHLLPLKKVLGRFLCSPLDVASSEFMHVQISFLEVPWAHLHMLKMLGFVSFDINQASLPTPFCSWRLCLSLLPFQLYFIPLILLQP